LTRAPREVILEGMSRIALFILIVALALLAAPVAGGGSYIYWWQHNMPTSTFGHDPNYHNHNYNELYFGPNAGWWARLWELTPAGYTHFVQWCNGNCFYAHPPYYYTSSYCANRDPYGTTHFVYDCKDQW
jgi:hypothetical protein